MDSPYAVVHYIAAVPNEVTSYTVDAKPKAGSERYFYEHANRAFGELNRFISKLRPVRISSIRFEDA